MFSDFDIISKIIFLSLLVCILVVCIIESKPYKFTKPQNPQLCINKECNKIGTYNDCYQCNNCYWINNKCNNIPLKFKDKKNMIIEYCNNRECENLNVDDCGLCSNCYEENNSCKKFSDKFIRNLFTQASVV